MSSLGRDMSFDASSRFHSCGVGWKVPSAFVLDMVVDDALVLEIKAVSDLDRVHRAQLRTYLRVTGKSVGLLVNFNVVVLRDGIRRVTLGGTLK